MDEDPWEWTVDKVVRNLCHSIHLWAGRPNSTLPDSKNLEISIRENGVNGSALLTDINNDTLKNDLEVKGFGQRSALIYAVEILRDQSPGWKSHQASKHVREQQIQNLSEVRDREATASRNVEQDQQPTLPIGQVKRTSPDPPPQVRARHGEIIVEDRAGGTKRRKIVLETTQIPNSSQNLRTFKVPQEKELPRVAYLGKKKLSAGEVVFGSAKNGDVPYPDIDPEKDDDKIEILVPATKHGIGRDLFIYRRVRCALRAEPLKLRSRRMKVSLYPERLESKRLSTLLVRLLASRTAVATKQDAIYLDTIKVAMGDISTSEWDFLAEKYPFDELDEGLPPLGESQAASASSLTEDESKVDETEATARKPVYLPKAEIEDAIDKALESFKHAWMQRNLPVFQSKARLIWLKARRDRQVAIATAEQALQRKLQYLQKLRQRIVEDCEWKNISQVTKQCKSMEVTSMTISELQSTLDVLKNPVAPQRVARLPKPPQKSPLERDAEDSDEIEVESDSDHLGEFIEEDDDQPQPALVRARFGEREMSRRKKSHQREILRSEPGAMTDGSGQPRARPSFVPDGIDVIDLTEEPSSPADPIEQSPRLKAPEDARREEINAWDIEELEERADRKRLLLKILWDMNLQQYAALREKCFKMNTHEYKHELKRALGGIRAQSDCTVEVPIKEPDPAEVLARLFVCWTESDGRHINAQTTSKKAIQATQTSFVANFTPFRTFLHVALSEDGPAFRESDLEEMELAPRKRRRRKIKRTGQDLRDSAVQRRVAGLEGAQQIALELQSSNLKEEEQGFVINPGKGRNQDIIFVDKSISDVLKPHQIEGIKFLWQEVVLAGHDGRSGCLLAHTMGLGKTLQMITFLLTLLQASSRSSSVFEQIPTELQPHSDQEYPRIMILCPPSLIQNWVDEFRKWISPSNTLHGYIQTLDSHPHHSGANPKDRNFMINLWFQVGGVLILGYEIFRSFFDSKQRKQETTEKIQQQLREGPALVIADEAHKFKDPTTKTGLAMGQLNAHCRVALTGSPLANNLGEYYALIDWVAPSYLGEADEFREIYQRPIEDGTYADSTYYEQRRSTKKLQALKEELEPKVHRKDITAIRSDLPPKMEFVIRVDLNNLQRKAYSLAAAYLLGPKGEQASNTRLFDWINLLSLLNYNPHIFFQKLLSRENPPRESKQNLMAEKKVDDQSDIDVDAAKLDISATMLQQQKELFGNVDESGAAVSAKTQIIEQIVIGSYQIQDRVLIFSHLLPVQEHLQSQLKKAIPHIKIARLQGSTLTDQRVKLCKAFNAGEFDVMLISTKAGGLGLNLFGANRIILADFGWNPSWEEQAVGRAYRLGQHKPVFVYHLLCGGTFEEPLHQRTVFKKQLSIRAVDKKNAKPIANKMKDFIFTPQALDQKDLSEFVGVDVVLDNLLQAEDRSAIRSIATTDIMHQKDAELTAEELKEVKEMRDENRLRLQDPLRWKVMKQMRDRPDAEKHLESTSAPMSVLDTRSEEQKAVEQRQALSEPKPASEGRHSDHELPQEAPGDQNPNTEGSGSGGMDSTASSPPPIREA